MTTEIVGYLASALVVLSVALRPGAPVGVLVLLAAVLFGGYGVLVGSWPVVVAAVAVVASAPWSLRGRAAAAPELGLVEVDRDDPYLGDFLRTHLDDIHRSQPAFTTAHLDDVAFVVTRRGLPAGALLGVKDGRDLVVDLDYVVHAHRDSRIGRWLYSDGAAPLRDRGIRRVVARAETDVHRRYLEGVGFTPDGDRWVRAL